MVLQGIRIKTARESASGSALHADCHRSRMRFSVALRCCGLGSGDIRLRSSAVGLPVAVQLLIGERHGGGGIAMRGRAGSRIERGNKKRGAVKMKAKKGFAGVCCWVSIAVGREQSLGGLAVDAREATTKR